MKKSLSLSFTILVVLLFLPVPAMTTDLGANVAGCCSNTQPIATPMGVELAATEAVAKVNAFTAKQSAIINANIRNSGEAITAEIAKNREATSKLFENQNTELHKMITQFGMAQAELQNQERVGELSRFDSLCVGPEIGAGVQVGKKAEKQVTAKLEKDSNTYNKHWKNPDKLIDYHLNKDSEKINANLLFPATKTLAPQDLKHAQDMVELMINPYPEPQLPEKAKGSSAAKQYELLQMQKKALLSLPQLAFNKAVAANTPTLPLEKAATELYRQKGNKGVPETVVDGKISPYAFLELISDSRFGNPNWWSQVSKKNIKAVLSDSLVLDAARFEVENRRLELEQLRTLMAALENATQNQDQMHATLNQLYIDAVKEK